MSVVRRPKTPREKYGEELRLRRIAAGLTQEQLSEIVVCSPTLISHWEAGRRLPKPDDARKYAPQFAAARELEQQATRIQLFALTLVPGLLQTPEYARAVFTAYHPNYTDSELDKEVVTRTDRAKILEGPSAPVIWALLDEAVLRRAVGGRRVMAEQLHKIADMAEARRIRLHVLPYGVGAHPLMTSLLTLMSFEDSAPVAYVDAFETGRLMDDPSVVNHCQTSYALTLGDALSQQESLALVRTAAKEHLHDQQ
ncbi:helix-turn-helix domain-containing protein [Streptomyces lavenduligriseus]|uniref:Helix-turn-helix transcriptional regulator n=1 Tax=Streptomyces lavenduligriseus TaxID=67315 RepID=A0ABT0NY92_9ACTN|nr:helix-turn-helix transcriptional regulator [Streptomyces lavenduligriseus]MCL3996452.1 helix-turn-helix transcriptional regulator [Streptomyces lavenduligriseus]